MYALVGDTLNVEPQYSLNNAVGRPCCGAPRPGMLNVRTYQFGPACCPSIPHRQIPNLTNVFATCSYLCVNSSAECGTSMPVVDSGEGLLLWRIPAGYAKWADIPARPGLLPQAIHTQNSRPPYYIQCVYPFWVSRYTGSVAAICVG